MDLEKAQSIFLLGIKGVAMANLAVIFQKMGKKVTGTDTDEKQITDELLKEHGISFTIGFDPKVFPEGIDLVIYSAAHGGEGNPLIKHAKKTGIDCINQAEVLGKLIKMFRTSIAVAGSHGKTTTSALLSYALIKLGENPGYLIGAPSFTGHEGADFGKKEYFVIEADEYAVDPPKDKTVKFLHLKPTYILSLNVDFDHPDVFRSMEDVKKVFGKFFEEKKLVVCSDDADLMDIVNDLPKKQFITFGYNTDADIRIDNTKETHDHVGFELFEKDISQGAFTTKIFGKKNISNAAGVFAMLRQLGFEPDKIRSAISDFSGVKRRFEEIAHVGNSYLFDDYAHHPEEIKTTIEAARARFPDRKIIVLFQSHTYSRTKALLSDFAESLAKADYSLVAPIFPSARENPEEFRVSQQDIEKKAKEKGFSNVEAVSSMRELLENLKGHINDNQVIFTMGAGNIYELGHDIIELLKKTVV